MERTLYDEVQVFPSILPQALDADATVTGTDVKIDNEFNAHSALVIVDTGLWTDGVHTFTIEEADDVDGSPGAFTAVAAGDLLGGTTVVVDAAPEDNAAYVRAYIGDKAWLHVKCVSTGTTDGMKAAATILLGAPARKPVR